MTDSPAHNMDTIKRIAIELLEKYGEEKDKLIWACYGDFDDNEKELEEEIETYRKKIEEAEPVAHGKWHKYLKGDGYTQTYITPYGGGGYIHMKEEFQCTNCQKGFQIKTNYCPNCGAKMEEEKT